jgi:hypothetical protein
MASLVKFKDNSSVSNNKAELLNRIPVMLRQQLCCKITPAKNKLYRIIFLYIEIPVMLRQQQCRKLLLQEEILSHHVSVYWDVKM